MISSETPYKLAEIIQDTWPNLYRPSKDYKSPSRTNECDFFINQNIKKI
jgi:hypothetical protein